MMPACAVESSMINAASQVPLSVSLGTNAEVDSGGDKVTPSVESATSDGIRHSANAAPNITVLPPRLERGT